MADSDIKWRFRKMTRAEINQDPMEREFFDEEPLNTRLVREAIQNSLDAGIGNVSPNHDAPVRVRFSLAGVHNPLPPGTAKKYFDGLAPHLYELAETDDTISHLVARGDINNRSMPFLVVEDAGTVGLNGDWEQHDDSDANPAQNNHFYWFFRNVGRSGKGDADNGSWGLGKWVFPDASHASAYIAVTTRRNDKETLLMGQSVQTKHTIDGDRYAPYGYFAQFDDDGFSLPLRRGDWAHRQFIDQCINDFGLQYRSSPESSGLSIIIPFPRIDTHDEEAHIETPKILAAVIHNYFYPIINRKLEVTLDEGDDSPPIEITADTIDDVIDKADLEESGERSAEGYRSLFKMCRKCLNLNDSDYISIPIAQLGDENHQNLANWRRRYNKYDLLAFRVNTDVQRKRGATEHSSFRLYVQRDDALTEGHDYYVRGTLSITEMNFLRGTRARSLLVVDKDQPLATMLRDSEPPAHTIWRPDVHRVKDNWSAAQRRIRAVRNAPRDLLRSMESRQQGIQKDAFADIFYFDPPRPQPAVPSSNERHRAGGGPVNPPQQRSEFEVSGIQSGTGFQIRIPEDASELPEFVRLRVAYDAPRGNPLNRYQPNDFRLHGKDALPVTPRGCEVIDPQSESIPSNELRLRITDPKNFAISVQGFDPNRDVHVRVERQSEPNDGATL